MTVSHFPFSLGLISYIPQTGSVLIQGNGLLSSNSFPFIRSLFYDLRVALLLLQPLLYARSRSTENYSTLFSGWLNRETYVLETSLCLGNENVFDLRQKHLFCCQAAKFVTATYVFRVANLGNIWQCFQQCLQRALNLHSRLCEYLCFCKSFKLKLAQLLEKKDKTLWAITSALRLASLARFSRFLLNTGYSYRFRITRCCQPRPSTRGK